MELARGCTGGCDFCGCFSFWSGRHRYYSLERVIQRIKELKEKYKINHINLSDDNFMQNKKMVLEFSKKLIEYKINITWDTRARVNDLDLDILKIMKEAGCSEILVGIESADDIVLNTMNKKIHSNEQYHAVENILNCEILPILSLILGYSSETDSSIDKTLCLLLCLYMRGQPLVAYFHILNIVPGTRLYTKLIDKIQTDEITQYLSKMKMGNSKICEEDEKLIVNNPEIFSTFYYVSSEHSIGLLRFISNIVPLLMENYPYTLFLLKTIELSFMKLFKNFYYLEEKNINNKSSVEIFEDFINYIDNLYSKNILIGNILKFETIVHRAKKKNSFKKAVFIFEIDVVVLIDEIKNNIDNFKLKNYNKNKYVYLIEKVDSNVRILKGVQKRL